MCTHTFRHRATPVLYTYLYDYNLQKLSTRIEPVPELTQNEYHVLGQRQGRNVKGC